MDNSDPSGTVISDLSGAPQPGVEPLPQISFAEATSRKAEYFGNREWVDRYMAGDLECRRQMDQVNRGLTALTAAPPDSREAVAEHLLKIAPTISEAILDQARRGDPVSPYEYERVKDVRDALFQDEAWVQRFNAGDLRAREQYAAVIVTLMSRIRDNPQEK